jgi:tetratricopeptide (TPR) repeat protein
VSLRLTTALACAFVLCGIGTGDTATAVQPSPSSGLTAEPQLLRVYNAIFDARFETVPQLLSQTCPPAPAEACRLLDAVALWWQIQLDPANVASDGQFQSKSDLAIAAAEARTKREPTRAEAWFYLGGAYGARAQWRVLRGERLAAARDGKRIKEALERALQLDPRMQEAYFGIGLYHYYADVAPTAAKILRFLLLLPGGDRTEGLQEMLRAREHGALLRDEADYQLQIIYLWYEKQPQRALDLLTALCARHPRNPLFPQLIAQVQDVYFHDLAASLRTWRSLLEAARARRVAYPELGEMRARLGIASVLERMNNTEAAIEQLRAIVAAKPLAPFGAYAQAQRDLTRLTSRPRAVR